MRCMDRSVAVKKLFIITTLFFIFGCSSSTDNLGVKTTQNQTVLSEIIGKGINEPAILKNINVSLYSTKHPEKSQPMLVNVISERNEIMEFDSKLKMIENVELPINDVTEVYYLQLEYVKNDLSEYKDIVYVRTSETKTYIKEIKMRSEYNYDKFDNHAKKALLHFIGLNGWYKLSNQLSI